MTSFSRSTQLLLFAVLFPLSAVGADAQADTASIRQRMESNQQLVARKLIATSDDAERSRLVAQIGNIRVAAMIPELRASVTGALRRENVVQRDRARRARNGEVLGDQFDAELYLRLVEIVVGFGDPENIDALAGAVRTGGRALNGIADFGAQAVPALLAAIEADSANPDLVSGALHALRYIVEEHREEIPASQRVKMRALTMARLHSPQRFESTVVAAVELALADGSPALRSRVISLRDRPAQAFTAGAGDTGREDALRRRIEARLRGEPALPLRKRTRT